MDRGIRLLGIAGLVCWFHLMVELDRIWPEITESMERLHGHVGGREHALHLLGHSLVPIASTEERTATRRLLEVWAALSYGVLRSCSLTAATGVAVAAETAGVNGTDRHRRPHLAKRPCGDQDKKEEQ